MLTSIRGWLAALLLTAVIAVPMAWAAGIYPGFPAITGGMTGNETWAVDTNLSGGANPQTELITVSSVTAAVVGGPASSASATSTAATLNGRQGKITSEALTTAAGSDYALVLTNAAVRCSSIVLASVANGTNTTEGIAINRVQPCGPGPGQVTIRVRNTHASSALNGTLVISFQVLN